MSGTVPRYRAVRARGSHHPILHAAVEDVASQEITYVADAAMANFLAGVLNGLDENDPLPPAGEQHRPLRFQLTHDATGLTSGAAVVYVHGLGGRIVAHANDDEKAQLIARILNHVDYPMHGAGKLIPRVGAIESSPRELPEPTVLPRGRESRRFGVAAYAVGVALPIVLLIAVLAVANWPYAVAAVAGYLVFVTGLRVIVARI